MPNRHHIGLAIFFLAANLEASICKPHPHGNVSALIACINQANEQNGDIIDLGGGTYTLITPYLVTAEGGAGLPIIHSQMLIRNGTITRDQNSAFKFRLLYIGPTGNLSLDNMKLENGSDTSGAGGAIYVDNNGITNGVLASINNSSFNNNTTTELGGAIAANCIQGTVIGQITNSTFAGNSANTNIESFGGAIAVIGDTPENCFIDLITNSTFTKNTAGAAGGALVIIGVGIQQIVNSTFSGNSVLGNGICIGGGIALGESAIGNLESTIIAGNTFGPNCGAGNSGVGAPDILFSAATLINERYNLIGTNNNATGPVVITASFAHGTNSNGSYVGSDAFGPIVANLAPLAFNGGITKTMALLSNSIAKGAGSNPFGLAFDQRGHHFARETGGLTDIGAYQTQIRPHRLGRSAEKYREYFESRATTPMGP